MSAGVAIMIRATLARSLSAYGAQHESAERVGPRACRKSRTALRFAEAVEHRPRLEQADAITMGRASENICAVPVAIQRGKGRTGCRRAVDQHRTGGTPESDLVQSDSRQ